MNGINYFALSGQDETSKYCGILEIDGDWFILNAGIGTDITNQFGISNIIPDIDYLRLHKDKIKGIFVATPNHLNIGALPFFIEAIGQNVPIYTSEIGATIIDNWFKRPSSTEFNKANLQPNLVVLEPYRFIQHRQISFCAFKVLNSLPDSFGFVFHTSLGAVVFVDEFMVGHESYAGFSSDLHLLPQLTKNNVFLLIVGLQNVTTNPHFAASCYQSESFIYKKALNAAGRMIVGCYDNDLLTIKNVITTAQKLNLKLGIYSTSISKLVHKLVKMGYLHLGRLTFIKTTTEISYDPNSIVLVTGNYDRLYHKLYKILDKRDKNLTITDQDTFLLATVTKPGWEVKEARLLDAISRLDAAASKMSNSILLPIAGALDHNYLVSILKPQFVLPVFGYYKEYISYLDAVDRAIIDKRVIFLYNGERIQFDHAPKVSGAYKITKHRITSSYVNVSGVLDIGASVLLERQALSNFGLISVGFLLDYQKQIFSKPQIFWKGFIAENHVKNEDVNALIHKCINTEFEKFFKNNSEKIITATPAKQNTNLKDFKNQLKKSILRMIERKLQKSPIILLNIGVV